MLARLYAASRGLVRRFLTGAFKEGEKVFLKGGIDSKSASHRDYHLDVLGFEVISSGKFAITVKRLIDGRRQLIHKNHLTISL